MSDEEELVVSITKNLETGKISTARLATDDRVLARITDGIYRQPASALRELIANAYDADAANVYIQTDPPGFNKISIRDDGNGLTIESLASLIHHIGGSPKRTQKGVDLGVTRSTDPSLSPKGRRLIGKIGIGLFSVAQLTRHFQIITKIRGTTYRLVAEVTLKTYTEDDLSSQVAGKKTNIETGSVKIKSVPAPNEREHGTEIILMDLRPQTRDLLQSRDIWIQVDGGPDLDQPSEPRRPPTYHIGRHQTIDGKSIMSSEHLPWAKDDSSDSKFAKLFQAVVDEIGLDAGNPKLETVLDNYLRTLWTLSLSAPLDYITKHPFDISDADELDVYQLSNESKGQVTELSLKKGKSIRDVMGFRAPERTTKLPFRVFIDEIQLLRPLRFNDLPQTSHAIKDPILFVGKCEPDLSRIPEAERGGALAFEAYFLWTPKVVPTEHIGLLIRINDASGTLFDESFVKYQVAENTRLKQITAEIFVLRGLDAALNIDRESFNFAHPHYQYVMKWVHRSLRQLTNMLKQIGATKRAARARQDREQRANHLSQTVQGELERAGKGRSNDVPRVVFTDNADGAARADRKKGDLVFDPAVVFSGVPDPQRTTANKKGDRTHLESQVAAVAQILEAYGVFENMRYTKQQELLRSIVAVFAVKE